MKKYRQSNIELLRIILILMIILLHYLNGSMGGALSHTNSDTVNFYFIHILESISIIAVNVFVLITGYFSYKKKSVQVPKIAKLVLIMIFWGITLSGITVLFIYPQKFNFTLLKSILKSTTDQWFVVIYCILYLLIPYLNKLVNNISKKKLELLIAIGIFFFYFWPSFYTKTPVVDGGYGIINFIYLYFIGTYIRKYHSDTQKLTRSVLVYLCCALLVAIVSLKFTRAWNYNFIFNLIGSVAFFEIFRSIHIPHNHIINKLATYTFAVYLIDVNGFFNKFLYHGIFHCERYWNSNLMIVNIIVTVIGIYIICIVLEALRQFI